MEDLQHVSKLPKAPLQEVVFEARWKPDIDETTGREYDAEFELAQGRFYERLGKDFPYHHRVIPENAPVSLFQGNIIHQFWHADGQFPTVQFGPCIFTVNEDDKGYEWESEYRPLVENTLHRLIASYKRPLRFSEVKLLYIDAIDLSEGQDMLQLLQKLKLSLRFDIEAAGPLEALNLDLGFPVDNGSTLQLSVRKAINNVTGLPSLLWSTSVRRTDCEEWEEEETAIPAIMAWCEYAHSVISKLFKQMTTGELYDSFL